MNQSNTARIAQIDIIRGVAVLGILTVNIMGTGFPFALSDNPLARGPIGAVSLACWLAVRILFEGKFVTIFSALFGASLLLVGGEGQDKARNAIARRRLGWLLVFALIHGLVIWWGDILLWYALCGFIAYFVRGWPARRLLIIGLLLCAVTMVAESATVLAVSVPDHAITAKAWERMLTAFGGDLTHTMKSNLALWIVVSVQMAMLYSWITVGLMMIGIALLKAGVLSGERSRRFYGVALAVGALALAAIAVPTVLQAAGGFRVKRWEDLAWVANTVAAPLVSLGYLSLVVLILKAGLLRRATRALGQVGRMAFSNYIAQSLIMTAIFWGGRGLGLYGRLSFAEVGLIVLAIWAAQLVWSGLWLARFHYGPLEWVWRRLSCARPTPFRRR